MHLDAYTRRCGNTGPAMSLSGTAFQVCANASRQGRLLYLIRPRRCSSIKVEKCTRQDSRFNKGATPCISQRSVQVQKPNPQPASSDAESLPDRTTIRKREPRRQVRLERRQSLLGRAVHGAEARQGARNARRHQLAVPCLRALSASGSHPRKVGGAAPSSSGAVHIGRRHCPGPRCSASTARWRPRLAQWH